MGFAQGHNLLIGLAGSRGGGRTVLTTVLLGRLLEGLANPFDAAVRMVDDGKSLGLNAGRFRNDLLREGFLPRADAPVFGGDHLEPTLAEWSSIQHRTFGRTAVKSAILSFLDLPANQLDEVDEAPDYLSACDGIIVTLDPFLIPQAREGLATPPDAREIFTDAHPLEAVERITEILRAASTGKNGGRIKVPVAIVVTKFDAFYATVSRSSPVMNPPDPGPAYQKADGLAVHEQVLGLLNSWGVNEIDRCMKLHYENYRYFAVSSLGTEPDLEKQRVDPSRIQPFRVEDPLLWILAQDGLIATK